MECYYVPKEFNAYDEKSKAPIYFQEAKPGDIIYVSFLIYIDDKTNGDPFWMRMNKEEASKLIKDQKYILTLEKVK